ncbi:hypothetical protein HTZ84_21025 [Haloterrigena sp. SYSU A558-1]|uniref:Uncharacterized protein n=1 Tax=Haloterrigena gelatinilytica TaxID=2741724 RepID=A0ABX2LK16_9EURY|nr:hypothetical protein [Haloterrigena gelatinilytica]NUC74748.1 hypothetical protein [Haloterrigena gelatinilytica]
MSEYHTLELEVGDGFVRVEGEEFDRDQDLETILKETADMETKAEKIQREFGNACGRELAVRRVNKLMDDLGLTPMERFDVALDIMSSLQYKVHRPWREQPSYGDTWGDEDEREGDTR